MNKYDYFNEHAVETQQDKMLQPLDEPPVGPRIYCAYCTEEIEAGEDHKIIGNEDRVHDDCWNDYATKELQAKDVRF